MKATQSLLLMVLVGFLKEEVKGLPSQRELNIRSQPNPESRALQGRGLLGGKVFCWEFLGCKLGIFPWSIIRCPRSKPDPGSSPPPRPPPPPPSATPPHVTSPGPATAPPTPAPPPPTTEEPFNSGEECCWCPNDPKDMCCLPWQCKP